MRMEKLFNFQLLKYCHRVSIRLQSWFRNNVLSDLIRLETFTWLENFTFSYLDQRRGSLRVETSKGRVELRG